MRKYLSFAVVALSSGGALVTAAGAAGAATANDNWRAAPWLGSSPMAMHAAPFEHHHHHDHDALCGAQKADYRIGKIEVELAQKGCLGSGDWDQDMPTVPGPPPVGSPHDPCPTSCTAAPPSSSTPPTPPTTPTPLVPPPPPVPCPPPTPNPCLRGEDHGRAASQAEATQAPAEATQTPAEATQASTDATQAPAEGSATAGLPIVGSAPGGLL